LKANQYCVSEASGYVDCVAIGKPERHARKTSHCGSK